MTTQRLRLLGCALLTALAALLAPATASAASNQLSLIQDDREFLGGTGENLDAAAAELKNLGVDILRTNVNYNKVYRTPKDRKKPADFTTSDPNSSHYDWSAIDRLVALAKANNVQVLMTVTGPGPFFSSESPSKCRKLPCTFKPKTSEFEQFAAAVAKRYRGKADYYAIWNEPNIGKTWLTPRFEKRRGVGTIDYAAAKYRQLYFAGYKSIAKYDPARRNRVLFGETAAISAPIPFLRAALCLDSRGNPFRGARARAQGCSGRVKKMHDAGLRPPPLQPGRQRHAAQQVQDEDVPPDRLHPAPGAADRRRRAAGADRSRPGRVHHRVRLPVQPARPDLEREPDRAGPVHQRVRPPVLRFQPREVGGPVRAHRRPAAGPVQLGPAVRGRQAQARVRGLPDADRGHPQVGQLRRGLRPVAARRIGHRGHPVAGRRRPVHHRAQPCAPTRAACSG